MSDTDNTAMKDHFRRNLDVIELLARDRDEWKRRALAAEDLALDLQSPKTLSISCPECRTELLAKIEVKP